MSNPKTILVTSVNGQLGQSLKCISTCYPDSFFELSDIDCVVSPIVTKDYPTPATRPHYSLLNKAKIKQKYDLNILYCKDSLMVCLQVLKKETP